MPNMTGARCMAEMLRGYGVTALFFVPAFLKGLLVEAEKLGIKRVLCHAEKAAAYMADGYARAAGRPGVALAQSVGAANLAAGLQDAYLGGSPVLALTGRRQPRERYRHAYQEIDHAPFYAAVTKFNANVDEVEQLPFLLRQAFREATTGAPAPVHLDLAGIYGEGVADVEADLDPRVEPTFAAYPALRPEPTPALVQQAVARLAAAERPVLIAGGGAANAAAGPAILRLAERLALPVATSLNAKGIIPEDHPLALGLVGNYSRACANRAVAEADLILFVGSHTGSQVTNYWSVPRPGMQTIQIDIDPTELGRNYPTQVALLGDARVTVERIFEALESVTPRPVWAERAGRLVAEWRAEMEPWLNSDAVPIRPERLCRELTRCLPSDAILVSDTGHAGMWTGALIDLTRPGQRYLRAAGSLGWGFPAALGAKCACPGRPVLCFTGDGGFWYHLSELETARRCGIHTVTVVNNNRSLNQDKGGVDAAYREVAGGRPDELWMFQDVDFAQVARALGCFGARVERPAELQPALEQAFAAGRPAVIDVVSDIDAFAPLAWTPPA